MDHVGWSIDFGILEIFHGLWSILKSRCRSDFTIDLEGGIAVFVEIFEVGEGGLVKMSDGSNNFIRVGAGKV